MLALHVKRTHDKKTEPYTLNHRYLLKRNLRIKNLKLQ